MTEMMSCDGATKTITISRSTPRVVGLPVKEQEEHGNSGSERNKGPGRQKTRPQPQATRQS
jgi:hypothetical protein